MRTNRIALRQPALFTMSCLASLLSVAFFVSDVHADTVPAPVVEQRVRILTSPPRLMRLDSLTEWCHGVGHDACTVFVMRKLSSACAPAEEGWTMRGTVSLLPKIYLASATRLPQQLTYIRSIQKSTEQYLERMERRRYAGEQACREAAALEEANFAATFRSVVAESQPEFRAADKGDR